MPWPKMPLTRLKMGISMLEVHEDSEPQIKLVLWSSEAEERRFLMKAIGYLSPPGPLRPKS